MKRPPRSAFPPPPTPYDTGERLEPHVWKNIAGSPAAGPLPHEDYGKVDFDNDEGGTEFTLYVRYGKDGYEIVLDDPSLEGMVKLVFG